MRCPACGKQLPEDPYYCAYCGALVQAPPSPLPRVSLSGRTLGRALLGGVAAMPPALGFWFLAGLLLSMGLSQRLVLGALVAGLSGALSAGLHGQLRWPLDVQPARASARQLVVAYGFGGALTLALGAGVIGAVVLPLGWRLSAPSIPALLAGATSGLVGAAFGVPAALTVGALAGYALGQLAGRTRPAVMAWAAAVAWWLGGSAGGGVVGAFVAGRASFDVPTGAYLGAIIQSLLQVFFLPAATHLFRWALVAIN